MIEDTATEKGKLSTVFDKLLPPESRTKEEFLTVLNAVTAGRFTIGLSLVPKVRENPGANWKAATAVMALDKESWLAKLGDLPKVGDTFKKLGFRKSEPGRLADPAVDAILGYKMLSASMDSGAVPGWLGKTVLIQKAVTVGVTSAGVMRGREMSVTTIGQYGEAVKDGGLAAHLASENIESPLRRTVAKIGAAAVTLTGVGMSTYATLHDYIPQAFGNLPEPFETHEPTLDSQVA